MSENNVNEVVIDQKIEKRGRPTVEGSNRQIKLAAIAAKVAAGETIKRGRPVSSESSRQIKLATAEFRRLNGETIQRGRPKGSVGVSSNKPKVITADLAGILADLDLSSIEA